MDGEAHEPRFLRLEWGDGVLKHFDCRLDHVDIKYTSFARSGAPLRAELVTFIADVDEAKQASAISKASPDLSHVRVVRSGDTLPQLCQEIYGSPLHYLHHSPRFPAFPFELGKNFLKKQRFVCNLSLRFCII